MSIPIYYHDSAGVFSGVGKADPSPLEPGGFLIPANAKTTPPPAAPDGMHAVFAGDAWRLVADPAPEEPPPPPPPPTLAEIQAARWNAIQAERDRRSESGGYPVGDKWFHSDQRSRSQQLGLVLLGAGIPPDTWWKTMDGSFVQMTPTLAQQILAAGTASDMATFAVAEAHKAAMEASDDPANYDFSGGWPPIFDEAAAI